MRKHLKIMLIMFISSILFIPSVEADRGDLRFNVTEVSVNGSNVTFKGWAFIHRTNNYRTVYKNGDKNSTVIASNGGQTIKIAAYKNGTTLIEEKTNPNDKYNNPNYNFYYEHFYKTGANIDDTYNGGLSSTSCGTWCYYQDMAFEITFDASKWQGISTSDSISFKIFVTNNSYGKWVSADVYALQKNIKGTGESKFLKINKNELTDVVRMIVINGRVQRKTSSGGLDYENVYGANGQYYMIAGDNSFISKPQWSPRTEGQEIIPIYVKGITNCTYSSYDHNADGCYPGTCYDSKNCTKTNTVKYVYSSYVLPAGKLEIKLKEEKKCNVVKQEKGNFSCDGSGSFQSDCAELTVSGSNVKIEQSGVISSILTPTEVYEGGPFHLGIMYYNTVKWSCINGDCGSDVSAVMQKKVEDLVSFKNKITLKNVKFNGVTIDGGLFVKECYQNGSFKKGDTLTTICTFFLPKSDIEFGTGVVRYGTDKAINEGINNKYYTDMPIADKTVNYPIELSITGMSVITDNAAKADSVQKNTPWTGVWDSTVKNCNLKVYARLYKPGKKEHGSTDGTISTNPPSAEYAYIYRPIDLYNPFPNRFAGVNWFEWYHGSEKNKERLKNTYKDEKNLEYQIRLNSEIIGNIRGYNKNRDYLDWYGIDPITRESAFVEKYFDKRKMAGD